jgi:hypothetical protein
MEARLSTWKRDHLLILWRKRSFEGPLEAGCCTKTPYSNKKKNKNKFRNSSKTTGLIHQNEARTT